ncbi:unnamed protein product [Trifolium pratense]|uniref:Uncharacterized protein n=1 Tax=Trifolium pratense TaxID=57577 RepID=A0ACB0KWH1_TRIPR|nr:unnamed protein product [Trifolium pratense]
MNESIISSRLATSRLNHLHIRDPCCYHCEDVIETALHTLRDDCPLAWQAPSVSWIRLNTDGAAKVGAIAGCGGVLRGNNVEWIFGFSKNIGICSAYVAELWGVLECLKLARLRGVTKIELHVDSHVVVKTLQSRSVGSPDARILVQSIMKMLALNWEVVIEHTIAKLILGRCVSKFGL